MGRVCPGSGDGEGRAAFARRRIGRSGERGAEFAGGKCVEGAEAGGELGSGQAAVAVEPAEEIRSWDCPFVRIAFQAAGHQVAVGIAARADLGHNVIQALDAGGEAAETVEAKTALARVDGLAEQLVLEEIDRLHRGRLGAIAVEKEAAARGSRKNAALADRGAGWKDGANLLGQEHLDMVTSLAAAEQAQGAAVEEAADGRPSGALGDANSAGEPSNGEADARLAF